MSTIIVDLDGTLSNCAHRVHHAQEGRWDEFHSLLMQDKPNMDVYWFLAQIQQIDCNIVVLTGRNEAYRTLTLKWFYEYGCAVDHLLMRPDQDYAPDVVLKPRLLEEHMGGKPRVLSEVRFVLEDRDKVVEAWRDYGLTCWQVRPGGY
jgi:hypothetical protein